MIRPRPSGDNEIAYSVRPCRRGKVFWTVFDDDGNDVGTMVSRRVVLRAMRILAFISHLFFGIKILLHVYGPDDKLQGSVVLPQPRKKS